MTSEEFHVARYNGILAVMKKDRERFNALEKKYKLLQSEFNILKRVHLNVINDCLETKHQMREKIKKQNADYNKLLNREQNKGWNPIHYD